eukprot:1185197-Prorocentrum_minimum.AAC.3
MYSGARETQPKHHPVLGAAESAAPPPGLGAPGWRRRPPRASPHTSRPPPPRRRTAIATGGGGGEEGGDSPVRERQTRGLVWSSEDAQRASTPTTYLPRIKVYGK